MMRIVLSCGNNRILTDVARACNVGIGARLPGRAYAPLAFADCHWRRFRFEPWLSAIARNRPETATLPDILTPADIEQALQCAEAASAHVTRALIVVPKHIEAFTFPSIVNGIDIWWGYSVPSRYGACELPIWLFRDRPVHLLGGTPQQQRTLLQYLHVAQADGTAIISAARRGTYFDGRVWRQTPRRSLRIEDLVRRSLLAWKDMCNR